MDDTDQLPFHVEGHHSPRHMEGAAMSTGSVKYKEGYLKQKNPTRYKQVLQNLLSVSTFIRVLQEIGNTSIPLQAFIEPRKWI